MSIFSQVSMRRPKSNTFDLSHTKKLSTQIGELTPVLCVDLVPGDSIKINSASLCRFAPMVAPVMHRFDLYLHFFFVPNRIMWPNWETFITGGTEGDDTTVPPFFRLNGLESGTLGDYLGLPTHPAGTNEMQVSAFQINGYERIFAEYFRDQNLTDFVPADLNDGGQLGAERYQNAPFKRAWKKDYFTSALPWTQRGPEATIPLGTEAPLINQNQGNSILRDPATGDPEVNATLNTDASGFLTDGAVLANLDITGHTVADLSQATASSINDLRRAFRLQEFLEKNARGGARYTEVVLSHFGVKSSDARLQRPEFIGGSKTPIQISEVLQTSGTAGDTEYTPTPQGNMSGHGVSVGGSQTFAYRAEEHGFLYCLLSVMPHPAYQQGLPRQYSRLDKLDYYWPSFANIGEQPIANKELYYSSVDDQNEEIFGYTPRYAEYKYHPSTVHGDFRTTLDFWHAGRIFNTRPALNSDFIGCDHEEIDRIFAVTDPQDHKLWIQVAHNIKARRPMPYFGTPSI